MRLTFTTITYRFAATSAHTSRCLRLTLHISARSCTFLDCRLPSAVPLDEKMDGKNSTGRRISLLNDADHEARPALNRLPALGSSWALSPLTTRSRTSSYASSSPPTPHLVRSDSTDSAAIMQTPSPITPDFLIDQNMGSPVFSQNFYAQKESSSVYPPVPQDSSPAPYSTLPGSSQLPFFQGNAGPDPQSANSQQKSKKNQYPCPLAKHYSCPDYFTTSGHAARHAKKHTGKKDAICPDCNKAFTRKDNMEQHRRTHMNGRNANKTGDAIKKATKPNPAKRQKPAPLQASRFTDTLDTLHQYQPMEFSPRSTLGDLAPAVQPVDGYAHEYSQRSPYANQFAPAATSVQGLDALAMAASGEKRSVEP